ncbi:malectin domain-containing carbohydrate-binding protein [Chryseolinea sp. H1M3-3]|uniref:malectin domain-containing carbohydrate-binding protein n=1 Tax=Chryseolinea sp. H1M3-3 TaxID=3034144 RepID=UPI0023EC4039|nr:malectin domain-containing carbohydrate-binding protein [Chryseolinea sp. H1M3-3]
MKYFLLSVAFLLAIGFAWDAQGQAGISFTTSKLTGATLDYPTTLAFGRDNRLYVTQQDGTIFAYTVQKNGAGNYAVTNTETINLIKTIQNHDDRGGLFNVARRQLTGLVVTGTAANPVLYICSSDFRIGGGGELGDIDLDTNSGMISKLTKVGNTWQMVHVVRGLPRAEENHSPNGLALDEVNNILYVAQGGNTNGGSPSNNFGFLGEYALSAAILEIDLDMIDNQFGGSYTLPTLDDPTRPNNPDGTDVGDPFGGNDGLNQAKLVIGGPVQIYAPGFRLSYDLLITKTPGKNGRMYTIGNGGNPGWGGYPENEGTPNVTNNRLFDEPGSIEPTLNDDKINNRDGLHYVTGRGYYAGHPVPIRANPAGAGWYWFDNATGQGHFEQNPTVDWPPYPVSLANPIESDYRNPGVNDGALYTWGGSTNGMAEYTSTAFFNGAMAGDLLAASWDSGIHRIELTEDGTAVTRVSKLFSGFGGLPLDVIAQGDADVFPGTIWSIVYAEPGVTVFEPVGTPTNCSGDINNFSRDDDGDGYSNGDETVNGTDPCSAASKPTDFDQDFTSDLRDADDDNDGLNDIMDKFALDANNGKNTQLPLDYPFLNGNPGTGLFGIGHTGLMANYVDNYASQFDVDNPALIAGGAVGALSVPAQPGDAVTNNQQYAFQFGIPITPATSTFTLHGRLLGAPFFNGATGSALGTQSVGIYFGNGDQDNYFKFVLHANNGNSGFQILSEQNGAVVHQQMIPVANILGTSQIDLFIEVNAETGLVQCRYQSTSMPTPVNVGESFTVSGNLLSLLLNHTDAVAVGVIASCGNKTPFSATWDFMRITSTTTGSQLTNVIRINSGGTAQNFGGEAWVADQYFSGGTPYSTTTTIGNTTQDPIYQTERFGNFSYAIPVGQVGTYAVDLHLAEIYFGQSGQRVFNINIENGQFIRNNLDLIQTYGANNTANVLRADNLNITDGTINITFTSVVDNAKISGISVGRYSSAPTNTPPTVAQAPAAQSVPNTQASVVLQLGQIFSDDGGVNNLTFTVPNNTNPGLISNTQIVGTQLTLTLSGTTGSGTLTLQATDASNASVQTTFQLAVTSSGGTPTLTNVIRINAGGTAQNFGGEAWVADQYFTGGTPYSTTTAIANTTQDPIYQTERFGNFSYAIPVGQAGTYAVDLHLAEIYFGQPGQRVFNINIENGQFVRNNLDLIQTYGANNTARVLRADNLNITDGTINITFTSVVDNAKISGIAVGRYSGGSGARSAMATNQKPIVHTPPNAVIHEGQAWTYQVIASDPEGDQLSYSTINLPASLYINKATGLIKGTIEVNANTFPVTIKVTDGSGLTTEVNFVLTIAPAKPIVREVVDEKFIVYPNPTQTDEFSVKLEIKRRDEWNFTLMDFTGKQINLGSFELDKGVQELTFDLTPYNVSSGLYYLSVQNGQGKKVIKIGIKL